MVLASYPGNRVSDRFRAAFTTNLSDHVTLELPAQGESARPDLSRETGQSHCKTSSTLGPTRLCPLPSPFSTWRGSPYDTRSPYRGEMHTARAPTTGLVTESVSEGTRKPLDLFRINKPYDARAPNRGETARPDK